jgi:hypothetical protein
VKKVHLAAVGVLGIASAAGITAPSAAAATHPPKKPAKTVSMRHSAMRLGSAVSPDTGCPGHAAVHGQSRSFSFTVFHTPQTHCIGGTFADLKNSETGLELRTRAYSNGHSKPWLSSFTGGTIHRTSPFSYQSTTFYQGIHQERVNPEQVCGAIVIAKNKRVLRGPICFTF